MSIDVKEIWKLDGCSKHEFSIDITPDKKLGKNYRCVNCGGEVSSINKYWYEKGLEHGTIKAM